MTDLSDVMAALSTLEDKATTAKEMTDALLNFLVQTDGILVDWVNQTISYSGFDPQEMRDGLIKTLTKRQVAILVMVGISRGNNVDRIVKTMKSLPFRTEFKNAASKAGVKKSVSGDSSAVTLSRIIACFPEFAATYLSKVDAPMALDYSKLHELKADYPRAARHQVSASIVPRESISSDDVSKALTVVLYPHLLTSEIINTRNANWKSKTMPEKIADAIKYLTNSYESKIMDESARVATALSIGMIVSKKGSKHQYTLAGTWVFTYDSVVLKLRAAPYNMPGAAFDVTEE